MSFTVILFLMMQLRVILSVSSSIANDVTFVFEDVTLTLTPILTLSCNCTN